MDADASILSLSPCQVMELPSVMMLPLLVVIAAGIYYIYTEVIQYMSQSVVRNKVVVITDAVSGVGSGEGSDKDWLIQLDLNSN